MRSGAMRIVGTATLGAFTLSLMLVSACSGKGERQSIKDALASDPKTEFEKTYTPKPKPRPNGLPPPTDAELKAWDRKDPEGEKHLYKYDKKNLSKMLNYWEELECFREAVKVEGAKAFGVEPGTPEEEQWFQFKQLYVPKIDQWQKRLFSKEPRILEQSKFISSILEAHEHVMNNYPKAYNDGDKVELEKVEVQWQVVEQKVAKYVRQLTDKEWERLDLSDPKQKEKHDKFCTEALETKKQEQRKKKGSGGKRKAKRLDI